MDTQGPWGIETTAILFFVVPAIIIFGVWIVFDTFRSPIGRRREFPAFFVAVAVILGPIWLWFLIHGLFWIDTRVDRERLGHLEAEAVLSIAPDGAFLVDSVATAGFRRLVFTPPSGSNDTLRLESAGSSVATTYGLDDGERAAAWFMINALRADGWTLISSTCQRDRAFSATAVKALDGFVASAETNVDSDRVAIRLEAPFHTIRGDTVPEVTWRIDAECSEYWGL